jgi:hypothetical protein
VYLEGIHFDLFNICIISSLVLPYFKLHRSEGIKIQYRKTTDNSDAHEKWSPALQLQQREKIVIET